MAEECGTSSSIELENIPPIPQDEDDCEPLKKKLKTCDLAKEKDYKLEERLNGILCCAVCLDLSNVSVFQCTNGHLMCAGCLAHLLADARLKDESATCPNCRCEISKTLCSRNLAVEKAISELPAECQFCSQKFARSALSYHEKEQCFERLMSCKYGRIGCPWRGPFHELSLHQQSCPHPNKHGDEIMGALQIIDDKRATEGKLFSNIFNLLSLEKITFSDLQLRPYRTDDFITKLYYETSRFSAFNLQWVVKARINDALKNPAHSASRSLSYQLVLKTKVPSSMRIKYLALSGPYGEMSFNPCIYEQEFSNESQETEYLDFSLSSDLECNKLLSAKTINFRLILFQVQK